MIDTQQASPLKLDTPVGWWRCTYSNGKAPFDKFEVGKLYPCVQDGPGIDIEGHIMPATRRSYRVFPDATQIPTAGWSPYWGYKEQRFCYEPTSLDFEFVRRFTRAEQNALCDQGCSPKAFATIRTAYTKRAKPRSLLDVLLGRPRRRRNTASEPAKVGSTPEAPLRYYFEYKGSRAVVFKRTLEWGIVEVGSFKYGADAQEYVDIKNDQSRRQHT